MNTSETMTATATAEDAAAQWRLEPAACPVCEEPRARFLGYRGGWAHHAGAGVAVAVVRCVSCGTIYPNPAPKPVDHSHYDDAEDYFGSGGGDDGEAIASFGENLQRAEAILGRRGALLDVGCGLGLALVAAERRGWEAVGVEPSITFADEGRRRFGVDIRDGFFEPDSFPASSFDVVVLSGVLEHVFDPVGLLRQAGAVLRPGGLVYIDVPNESGWMQSAADLYLRLRRRSVTVALSPTFAPFHVVGFSRGSLGVAIERAGMRAEEIRSYPLDYRGMREPAGRLATLVDRLMAGAGRSGGLVGWAAKPH
ncbi:MAG: SAM-dependent methyltransferase [Solirubrobacterales bacterium]|nr:SAM-dependent methyltransferase [Solirubrobacterales bacterium]